MRPLSPKPPRGFSLVELLVVVAIMGTMMALSGPVVTALSGSGSVNKAIIDLSRTLEQARAYAMANGTYVRVGFGEITRASGNSGPSFVVLCLYSNDGTLAAADGGAMATAAKWPYVTRPLVLDNFHANDALGTASDTLPRDTDIPHFVRQVNGLGAVRFNACIQFGPSGVARVQTDSPARFIKVALDRPAPMDGKNPFVIRVGGMTGAITVLRKENL
ncbi:type II secretion system protein H [Verrucomicrobium sp. GAS474]|uniref:prepilin-type N-terminal cleavage/methylation domain-containing protein n=1 Tax=Verrucomicrobium sp. GAS474 TaxID=1882831 RepID=UPI00087C20E2|nr:prepilin-type N-terminal cleavage/methylation domain-containing protein [Verrucomicrobium sp. GAS474]SDT93038.1 type II secretion system protein H [Verrucomicrobium sp. GAS474]